MQLTVLPGPGEADHRFAALTAEQFAGENIVCIIRLPADRIRLVLQIILHVLKLRQGNDGGHAALDPDVRVLVHASVHIIFNKGMEAAFVPFPAVSGFNAAPVQIRGDVRIGIAVQHPLKDLFHDGCCFFVYSELSVLSLSVSQRGTSIDEALGSVIHKAAPDILRHVLAVKLIDIHHVPKGKASCGGIVEILLNIQAAHTGVSQAGIVDHSFQHIAAHAIAFPRNHGLEPAALAVPHHLLELGPLV